MFACSDSGVTSSDMEPDTENPEPDNPPSEIPELSTLVDSIRAEYNLPAMGAAIVSLDNGFTIGVAGERRIGSGVAVQEEDRWSWGSNTKAITGFVTAKAVDMGLIEWNQTLEELFPEFLDIMRDEYRSVTILDLLGHRSGFVNQLIPGLDGQPTGNGVTPESQRVEMLKWVLQQPQQNPKGEYYYSNLGYSTLGAILDRVFEMPYEEWATGNLTEYLDLDSFGFGPQDEEGGNNQPVSHRLIDGEWIVWEKHENTPFRRPSGGAHGSLEDWGKIIIETIKAEKGMSDFVTPESASTLSTSHTEMPGGNRYSAGWVRVGNRNWAEGDAWYHAGSNGANYSTAWVGPDAGIAFLVVMNGRDAEGLTENAASAMTVAMIDYLEKLDN